VTSVSYAGVSSIAFFFVLYSADDLSHELGVPEYHQPIVPNFLVVLYAHQLFLCKVTAFRSLSTHTSLPSLSRSVLTPNQIQTLVLREYSREEHLDHVVLSAWSSLLVIVDVYNSPVIYFSQFSVYLGSKRHAEADDTLLFPLARVCDTGSDYHRASRLRTQKPST